MKNFLIIVPDGGMLFEAAGIADILMQANRLHPEGLAQPRYRIIIATTQPHQVIHGQSGLNLLADYRSGFRSWIRVNRWTPLSSPDAV